MHAIARALRAQMGSLSSVPTSIPTKEKANASGQKQRFELGWLVGPQLVLAFERQRLERFASKDRQSEQRHSQHQQPQ